MATIRLVPSAYTRSSSSRVTVTDPTNMYYNTDHTANYCSIRGRNNSSNTYYAFIHGFNFDDIPSNATVSSFEIKIRCYKNSYLQQGTSYRPRLASSPSSSSVISNTTLDSDVTTTAGGTVYTFPTSSLSWNTIKGYGSNFSIEIPLRSSSSSYPYLYVYGAEINVTYTAQEVHVTGVDVSPATDSIEVGETTTLTATISPSNATNKTITWSTSNSSIATVSDGIVTGVAAGSARITATTQDGSYTDYCDITVTPAITYDFVPASSMEVGKDYLISIGNSGSIYLLTDESGGSRLLKGAAVTVSNGKITITGSVKSKALFSCVRYTSGNDNTITVEKDGKYLYCDNSNGLRMNAPATLDRFWHYRNNKFWQFKSTSTDGYDDTSSEYKYYLQMSGTNYTDNHVTSPSIEESTLPGIYIWVESSEPTYTLYYKSDESETLVGSDTSDNYDRHQTYVTINSGVIVPGDTVHVVLTDIRGWYSGQVKVSGSYEVEFVRNSNYGNGIVQIAYENGASSGKGVRVSQYNANSTLSILPYYSAQTDAEYDGTVEVYKKINGGWIPAIKVYKKVSGSWVEQDDLSTIFDENINYVKGN